MSVYDNSCIRQHTAVNSIDADWSGLCLLKASLNPNKLIPSAIWKLTNGKGKKSEAGKGNRHVSLIRKSNTKTFSKAYKNDNFAQE